MFSSRIHFIGDAVGDRREIECLRNWIRLAIQGRTNAVPRWYFVATIRSRRRRRRRREGLREFFACKESQFLAPFNLAFQPFSISFLDFHPEARAPHPSTRSTCILYSRAPLPSLASLFENHLPSSLPGFLLVYLFLLLSSRAIFVCAFPSPLSLLRWHILALLVPSPSPLDHRLPSSLAHAPSLTPSL